MEDYILKFYEKAKKECAEVEQGFERFDPKTRKKVIRCFINVRILCRDVFNFDNLAKTILVSFGSGDLCYCIFYAF